MKSKILLVAPFEELAGYAQEVIDERFHDRRHFIQVVKGDLKECLSHVRQAIDNGTEVIVSRGGTATLIEENTNLPVVHIQVTLVDVLRALQQNGRYPEKIGIAGFENVIYGCEDLAPWLGITFVEIVLRNEAEAREKISKAIESGVRLIIGDAISTRLALEAGIRGILIQSGKDVIYKAIVEADFIARIRREEREKSELLRMVVNASTEGIVVTDHKKKITIFNPMAEKLFQISHLTAIGKPLSAVIPIVERDHDGIAENMTDVQRIGEKNMMIKRSPIIVKGEAIGSIYALQNVSQLQQLEQNVRKKLHAKGLVAHIQMDDIVGESAACQDFKRKGAKYALTESTILITGSSGTGKEMLAQSIHNVSRRAAGPFVAVNCAALPENLLESELFGYEEGAFTGAKRGGRQGLFELAHGGTLFLDEVGEMPLPLQPRILRVLQEKTIMHLGGDSVIPVDVRIIAATNRNLRRLIDEQTFRQDLYYRLNILRIHLPDLQERLEDIPLLAKAIMHKMQRINLKISGIHPEAITYLRHCRWPGNIRQLANTLERAMLLSEGPMITKQDIIEVYEDDEAGLAGERSTPELGQENNLAAVEQELLDRVLREENYNYSRAAARLGIHRTTLWRKLTAAGKNKK